MPNKSAVVQGGLHSRRSKSTAELPNAAATARVPPATRVGLLAPGGPASLPSLEEVPSQYSFYTGKKLLFKLCQNLVEEGLATTRSWEKSKADPLAFVDESLRRWCFLHGLSRIEEELSDFSVAIRGADDQRLHISVQHWHLGQLVCRAPLTALEEQAAGLGSAFYQILAYTLVRSLGSWDLDDAAASVEQMREWASESREEESGAGDEFEIPDLDGCIPVFIAEARGKHVSIRHSVRILRAQAGSRFGVWIGSLLRMYALTRIPIDKRLKQDPEEEGFLEHASHGSVLHRKHGVYLDLVTAIQAYPEDYDQRLSEMYVGQLKRIRLFAVEPHDLALMKLERNAERDRVDVLFLASQGLVTADELERRYRAEMRSYIGVPERSTDITLQLWVSIIKEEAIARDSDAN